MEYAGPDSFHVCVVCMDTAGANRLRRSYTLMDGRVPSLSLGLQPNNCVPLLLA